MMSVAVTEPVEPVYVVPRVKEPCSVKLPVVPNVRPVPVTAPITEPTVLPVAKPVSELVPVSA